MSDAVKHECGVALLRLRRPAAHYEQAHGARAYGFQKTALMLEKQHNRGQDGAGLACLHLRPSQGRPCYDLEKSVAPLPLADLVSRCGRRLAEDPAAFRGELFLGHLRYATFGRHDLAACHPFVRDSACLDRLLLLAGNFNLTDTRDLADALAASGHHLPSLADGAVILGSHWDALCATDAATGKLLWRKADANFRFRGSVAAPDGKTVWVPARESLFQVEARTGKILRSKALGFSVENGGQPLLADGLILLTTVDAGLVALDRKCLEERWRLPVGEGLAFSAPYSHSPMRPIQGSAIRAGDAVIVAASDGCVHAADLVTGKRLWRRRLGAPLLGTPLAHGGRLYVADLLGTLHCLPLE